MKYGKLRIAWSVGWGLFAVLLCVLWVRSYWRLDGISGRTFSDELLGLNFARGEIVGSVGSPGGPDKYPWTITVGGELPPIETQSETRRGFGVTREPCVTHFYVPNWGATSLAAVVSLLPWLRWRFSLRTLLIAATVVAVGLGLIVMLTR